MVSTSQRDLAVRIMEIVKHPAMTLAVFKDPVTSKLVARMSVGGSAITSRGS